MGSEKGWVSECGQNKCAQKGSHSENHKIRPELQPGLGALWASVVSIESLRRMGRVDGEGMRWEEASRENSEEEAGPRRLRYPGHPPPTSPQLIPGIITGQTGISNPSRRLPGGK